GIPPPSLCRCGKFNEPQSFRPSSCSTFSTERGSASFFSIVHQTSPRLFLNLAIFIGMPRRSSAVMRMEIGHRRTFPPRTTTSMNDFSCIYGAAAHSIFGLRGDRFSRQNAFCVGGVDHRAAHVCLSMLE